MNLGVRVHGRGGQGVVTAAELLSMAAFDQGLHAQALPSFGSERTGAPVMASCRISDRPIRSHDPVNRPDVVVIQDPTLLRNPDVLAGLADDGTVVVNTTRDPAELVPAGVVLGPGQRWVTLPATDLARRLLGRPLPNTALVGAVAGVTSLLGPDAVNSAIRRRFIGISPEVADANIQLAEQARQLVTSKLRGSESVA
jgi:pyruvate ferredoxin oxidoreductase gamma subunit